MGDQDKREEKLEDEDLEQENAELLPDREAMSILDSPIGPPKVFPGLDEVPPAS
jgi:hypothetical protein